MEFKLDALMDTLFEVTRGEVNDGWAGGTCTLWSENKQGHVICLTEDDGPFVPFLNHFGDKVVDVFAFTVGVYGDSDDYLAGGAPLDGLDWLVRCAADKDLVALRESLRTAGKR